MKRELKTNFLPVFIFIWVFYMSSPVDSKESLYLLTKEIPLPGTITTEYITEMGLHCAGWYNASANAVGASIERSEIRKNFLNKAVTFSEIFAFYNNHLTTIDRGYSLKEMIEKTKKLLPHYENLIFSDYTGKETVLSSMHKSCDFIEKTYPLVK